MSSYDKLKSLLKSYVFFYFQLATVTDTGRYFVHKAMGGMGKADFRE